MLARIIVFCVGRSLADPLGVQGKRVVGRPQYQVFAGPLSGNRVVVALINTSPKPRPITVRWSQLGLPGWKRMKVRDLWKVRRPYYSKYFMALLFDMQSIF